MRSPGDRCRPACRVVAGRRLPGVLFALLLLQVAAAGSVSAADPSPGDAVSEARLLEAAIGGIAGLVADFTQTLESPALPTPQVERGRVYLMRPGRMRWEYSDPAGKLAIASAGRTMLYLPDERQLVRSPLGKGARDAGVSLLLRDRLDLVSEFDIGWEPGPGEGHGRRLKLTPRFSDAPYRCLLVETGRDRMLTSLAVVDALGSTVTYRFSHLRRVATLDEGLFVFTPPSGVEIQDVAP